MKKLMISLLLSAFAVTAATALTAQLAEDDTASHVTGTYTQETGVEDLGSHVTGEYSTPLGEQAGPFEELQYGETLDLSADIDDEQSADVDLTDETDLEDDQDDALL